MHTMRKRKIERRDKKAFQIGFWEGFLGAGLIFAPKSLAKSKQYDVSVSKAWSEVGHAFSEVMTREGAIVEQKTQQKPPRSKFAA